MDADIVLRNINLMAGSRRNKQYTGKVYLCVVRKEWASSVTALQQCLVSICCIDGWIERGRVTGGTDAGRCQRVLVAAWPAGQHWTLCPCSVQYSRSRHLFGLFLCAMLIWLYMYIRIKLLSHSCRRAASTVRKPQIPNLVWYPHGKRYSSPEMQDVLFSFALATQPEETRRGARSTE